MQELTHKEKWYASMRLKLGVSTDAEVRAYMKEQADKSQRNTGGGGFAYMKKNNPERLREVSIKGGKRRYEKA